jgi:hypothetical protein
LAHRFTSISEAFERAAAKRYALSTLLAWFVQNSRSAAPPPAAVPLRR